MAMALCEGKGGARVRAERQHRGRAAMLAGKAAEETVERAYRRGGATLRARRWRGESGEIDLVMQGGDGLYFVEVKAAANFERAAASLMPSQMRRIVLAAQEYVGGEPDGALTPMRFDLAMVNGRGEMQVLENAFGEF